MERLNLLFKIRYGVEPESADALTGSASPRRYYRLTGAGHSCIGVIGTDCHENDAFVTLSGHFQSKGIPVPQVYAVSDDRMAYIQEDLGGVGLFDMYVKARACGEGLREAEDLLCRTMALLPKIQFEGADGLDFNVCHPQTEFSLRSVMFDLNYFKYCFLKATGVEFHEMLLQDDFERFAEDLVGCGLPAPEGTGIIAGTTVRSVVELAGIKDITTKCYGSRNPINAVKAVFDGLTSLRTPEQVAALRGKTVEEILG